MKNNSFKKRTLSFVLCLSLLTSCLAFSLPQAVGATDWYDCNTSPVGVSTTAPYVGLNTGSIANNRIGKYRVRLCILEMDGFDSSIHDRPGGIGAKDYPYEPGFSFGYNNNQRNISGMSTADDLGTNEVTRDSSLTQHKFWCEWAQIRYKINNGTGTGVNNSSGIDTGLGSVWFNIGDQDAAGRKDIVSAGEYNYGYFPSDDGVLIDGFPTGFTTRYVDKGNGTAQYGVYMQVAVWDNSEKGFHWEEGTCSGTPGLWGALGGGWSSDYAGGIIYAQTNSVSTVSAGTELKISADLNESNSEDLAKFPYACKSGTTAYKSTDAKIPVYFASSQTSTTAISEFSCPLGSGTASCYVNFNSPTDQYGATMTSKVLLQTSNQSKTSLCKQSAQRTIVYYGANIAGSEDSQLLRATVTWQQKRNTSSCKQCENSTELTLYDAKYPVEWYSHSNTLLETEYYYFGDTPSHEVPYRNFDNVHYVNSRWNHAYEAVSDKSDNSYTALYDTAEHNYTSYTSLNNLYHKAECTADLDDIHYVTEEHRIAEEVIAPSCSAQGCTRHYCLDCDYYYDTDPVKKLSHNWNEGVVTTEPTCEDNGIMTYTCAICGEKNERIISALGHKVTPKSFTDENGNPIGVYFSCDRDCGAGYWAASFDEESGRYFIADETEYESVDEALLNSSIPASPVTEFNSFNDIEAKHNYSKRGASLRYSEQKLVLNQPLRFMASVKVPEGFSYAMGSEGNAIADVGFVYSLTSIVGDDKEALKLGKDDVYSISVAKRNENSGVYNGHNWGGVTKHESADGVHLSFNIVINVSYSDWSKPFSARAYTKYNYNGFEYTVYDDEYSSRSVEYIARKVVENPSESKSARDYCQNLILDNLT